MTSETNRQILRRLEKLETEVKELRSQLEEKETENEKLKMETLVDVIKCIYNPDITLDYYTMGYEMTDYYNIESLKASDITREDISFYFDIVLKMIIYEKIQEKTEKQMENLKDRIESLRYEI